MTRWALFNGEDPDGPYQIGAVYSTDGATWTQYASNPVITPGAGGTWNDDDVKDPWITFDGTQYVCYYSGSDGTTFKIGRATAPNPWGPWTNYASNPVLTVGAGGQYDDKHVLYPVVLYEPADTAKPWKMWFSAIKNADGIVRVGYATSTNGTTWTKYGMVLDVGAGGQWDEDTVGPATITKIGSTYYLFYHGWTAASKRAGLVTFTNPEGTYTRHPDNPLFNNRAYSKTLTGPLSIGGTVVTLNNTTNLEVGETVVLVDSDSVMENHRIASINSATQLTLATAVTANFNTGSPVLRSFMYFGVGVRTVTRIGGRWVMFGSPFQPADDLSMSGSTLREGTVRFLSDSITGPWEPDFDTGDLIALYPYADAAWASISAENFSFLQSPPGVWVDWGNDGTFDRASGGDGRLARMLPEAVAVVDEITSDVHSIDWSYGGSSDHVSGTGPGSCTLTVKNADGKYNPDNTSSDLYGLLKPGRPVWIGMNADGTMTGTGQLVYGLFAGYIREIVPLVEGGATALAEIICDDPLGRYQRMPTKVEAATAYSYNSLREAVLADIGETRTSLAAEIDTLPLASADSDNALSVLEEINRATGSRHWANPGDSFDEWYQYTAVDRHHKLTSAADADINGDDVQELSGYRVTAENVINDQRVDVSPARFPAGIDTVWTYAETTFPLTSKRTIWAQFEDFVKDATLDYTNTGSTVTAVLTNFGTTAKIELWSAGTSNVADLTIEGRQVVRDASEAVTAEDTTSKAIYGARAGSAVSSTYSSTPALAQGLANFLVWKFASPMKRPAITQINEFPTMLERDLYDVITLTVDRLSVVSRRFEIVGISGHVEPGILCSITWELQETPNQSAMDLFIIGESLLGGSDVLAA